jgi:putative transposase
MLLATLEAEVTGYIDALAGELDEHGHRLVVRNGYAEPRTITTAAGGIEIEAPRVNDRRVDPETGERCRFRSAIVPPWCRKSPKVAEVLPLMYLHGMSTGDFAPALTEFFGTGAGLSASVITRLSKQSGRAGRLRPPRPVRCRLRVRMGRRHPLQRPPRGRASVCAGRGGCALGRDQGAGGHRGRLSGVHRELGRPAAGPQTPGHAGPGAGRRRRRPRILGCAAGVFPATGAQRCWVHKVANVLSALPASAQPTARRMLSDIRDAEDRDQAVIAVKGLRRGLRGEVPQSGGQRSSTTSIRCSPSSTYPAEHWIHLKTTNPIESTFATVRLRTKVTKGPGSRAAGLAMAFKLIEAAQSRWRSVNGSHLVALVRAGAKFEKGVMVERPNPQDQEAAA